MAHVVGMSKRHEDDEGRLLLELDNASFYPYENSRNRLLDDDGPIHHGPAQGYVMVHYLEDDTISSCCFIAS
ncbi:MAG: hypothetical protein J4473_02570 [Candidatus Aenigmarchaeota archaeon]|nr:hypothetical protein [Candidatus Aenigmarchaeota archaeon]